jgi:hypothetical protein
VAIETLRNLPRPRQFKSIEDAQKYCEDLLGALERWHIETIAVGGNADVVSSYKVAGTQVVGARIIDARADDVANSGDATTDGLIDALRDAMIAHGLIAAA